MCGMYMKQKLKEMCMKDKMLDKSPNFLRFIRFSSKLCYTKGNVVYYSII